MTSPSMPYGNDSSGITTFATTVLSIDQMISCIGFHLIVYGSITCAQARSFRWNRITWWKHNDHTSVIHFVSHNRSHSSTLSRGRLSNTFTPKKGSTQYWISGLVDPDSIYV
ncbi:hypothetical protein LUZ60_015354 [Juncus effusus]|nr:hypothetical protein LUZ60_015354 [Juncus effusus]